jgi:hypothetical protein
MNVGSVLHPYRGWRVVFLPADLALALGAKRSYALYRAWTRYDHMTDRYFEAETPNAREPRDEELVSKVRREGYATFPAPLTEEEIAAARDFVMELFHDACAHADRLDPSGKREVKPWTGDDGIIRSFFPLRARFSFRPAALASGRLPSAIMRFADMPELRDVAGAYYGTGSVVARIPYYGAEVMWSAPPEEEPLVFNLLHIDDLRPFLKAYLMLDDVGGGQGPLCYVPGSHLVDEARTKHFYRIARSGETVCYFDGDDYRRLEAASISVTAPRNHIILFDPQGVHSAGLVTSGLRIILMNSYLPASNLRLNPRYFRDTDPQPYPWERPGFCDPRAAVSRS